MSNPVEASGGVPEVPPELQAEVDAVAFRHGYILRRGGTDHMPGAWMRRSVGTMELLTHPVTEVSVVANEHDEVSTHVVVVGQIVDVDTLDNDRELIARRVLDLAGDLEGMVRYVAHLGGRFAVLVVRDNQVYVLPDCTASQGIYWAMTDTGVAVASHSRLVALTLDCPPDAEMLESYGRVREVRPRGTIYPPGASTAWAGVRPVFANCRLWIDLARWRAEHGRFAPFEDRAETADLDAVMHEVITLVDRHIRCLAAHGRIGVSMTHGGDSLVTSLALLPYQDESTFAYTYVNPRDLARDAGAVDDLFGASARAFHLGIPHRVIRWRRAPIGSVFDLAVQQTWPLVPPSLGAAYAMHADLPRDFYELQSTVAEAGTAFYDKTVLLDRIDGRSLAMLWGTPRAERREDYIAAFDDYVRYTQMSVEGLRGFDSRNHFYWEHRLTRWAGEKYQVGDLGHRVLLPLNVRRVVEAMLSLPDEVRRSKTVIHEFARRTSPVSLDLL